MSPLSPHTPDVDSKASAENSALRHWRSLSELENTPEFQELLAREFPNQDPQSVPDLDRRRFLQLMGASAALASLSSCRWETEQILAFNERPENTTPGISKHYATCFELHGVAQPLLVRNYDGRPIKIEGNPDHPAALGASTSQAQALTLDWADPDRSRGPAKRKGEALEDASWEEADEFVEEVFGEMRDGGAGLAVLCAPTASPSAMDMRRRFLEVFPENAGWFTYEPLNRDNELEGARMAFGKPMRTHAKMAEADVQLWLDADPLGEHPSGLSHARDWATRRVPEDAAKPGARPMSRVYAVESTPSPSGAAADHRLPMRADRIYAFLLEIERRVTGKVRVGAAPDWMKEHEKFLNAVASDLKTRNGRSLVFVGERQPAHVHAVAHRLNGALGNIGNTVAFSEEPIPAGQVQQLQSLIAKINEGSVKSLLVLGGNPVFDAPADLGFAEALAKVATKVHVGFTRNETAHGCDWHFNEAHPLEAWGDGRSWDGTLTLCQPQILPLHGGRSLLEILARIAADDRTDAFEIVKRVWKRVNRSAEWFRECLHDGFAKASSFKFESPQVRSFEAPKPTGAGKALENGSLELVFTKGEIGDGRFANNGWLVESPDPMTKVTWDNVACVSPATAKALGLLDNMLCEVEVGGKKMQLPTYVLPGQATGTISIAVGWGRKHAGRIGGDAGKGVDPIGFDVYPLRTSATMSRAGGVSVRPTSTDYKVATTQDHFVMDRIGMAERNERIDVLIREDSYEGWKEHPDHVQHAVHHPPLKSLWTDASHDGHKWGMSIDLSRCIGCNACIVGCTSENNVPVVGKEQVLAGREMHWLRIDRYFGGDDPESPDIANQPLTCMHCENAPCEQVCPVAATVHSEEGLNDMVYNRCIGTRYCGNNCPYKVRRFNYFSNREHFKDTENGGDLYKLVTNPDVTVRSRGVMEKCTYCTQRISATRKQAKLEKREMRTDEIRTACQTACPTDAVVFGDLADEKAEVSKRQALGRSYALLGELNIKPRTQYLARITNPHPDLYVPKKDAHAAHGEGHGEGHGGDKGHAKKDH